MTAALAELTRASELATAERLAAEQHERQALVAIEQAKAAAADASRRRAGLADAVETAIAAEEAAMGRLGLCRLAAGDAAREAERLADSAAAGSDAAARSLGKSRETAENADDLAEAHERRVRALRLARESAEKALADHDLAEAARIGELYETAIIAEAEHADRLLAAAAEIALLVGSLIDARREFSARAGGVPIREPHQPALLVPHGRHEAARQAFLRAFQRLELSYVALGPQHRGSALGLGAREVVSMWALGRRSADKAA